MDFVLKSDKRTHSALPLLLSQQHSITARLPLPLVSLSTRHSVSRPLVGSSRKLRSLIGPLLVIQTEIQPISWSSRETDSEKVRGRGWDRRAEKETDTRKNAKREGGGADRRENEGAVVQPLSSHCVWPDVPSVKESACYQSKAPYFLCVFVSLWALAICPVFPSHHQHYWNSFRLGSHFSVLPKKASLLWLSLRVSVLLHTHSPLLHVNQPQHYGCVSCSVNSLNKLWILRLK